MEIEAKYANSTLSSCFLRREREQCLPVFCWMSAKAWGSLSLTLPAIQGSEWHLTLHFLAMNVEQVIDMCPRVVAKSNRSLMTESQPGCASSSHFLSWCKRSNGNNKPFHFSIPAWQAQSVCEVRLKGERQSLSDWCQSTEQWMKDRRTRGGRREIKVRLDKSVRQTAQNDEPRLKQQ